MSEKAINTVEAKELFNAISKLKNADECRKFFRDLCTLSELTSMIERLQAAKLIQKDTPYRKISQLTGASTTTVTRVAHWFHHGQGGYKLVLGKTK
ncbi:MAG: TrpR-like protein YerC/YecD [Candidatus Peregrinibacteria bacterium GW2011_GWF2_38_29]|nr:MAG: TrpR-like protein YerC/YecD [Candidatus Peregrinibacteria bacterium GW2011_GWF2_38_29]HBB02349.1 hypothetical protein [Candidatus Peregrinibacteria bacterium]